MPFLDPLRVQLLDDRSIFPWITLTERRWEDPVTGEIHTIPKHFRSDGSSIPKLLIAIPVIGQALALRYFGSGVWLGFGEGVLHDYLRRLDKVAGTRPVSAAVAHLKFRRALYEHGYPEDLCETYYAAVVAANSNDDSKSA